MKFTKNALLLLIISLIIIEFNEAKQFESSEDSFQFIYPQLIQEMYKPFTFLMNHYQNANNQTEPQKSLSDPWYDIPCTACHLTVQTVQHTLAEGLIRDLFREALVTVCSFYENYHICRGVQQEFEPILINSMIDGGIFSKEFMCSSISLCDQPKFTRLNVQDFVDRVTQDYKLDLLKDNNYLNKLYQNERISIISADSDQIVRILHITDPHIDYEYVNGTNAECGEPLCCRIENGYAIDSQKAAGFWGDYNCDPPERLIQSGLRQVKEAFPDLEMIIWTGDNIQHNIWNQTLEQSVYNTRRTTQLIKSVFDDSTLVLPLLGNHQPIPVNQYDTDNYSNQVNFLFADLWKDWLDDGDNDDGQKKKISAFQQFKLTGYYSYRIPSNVVQNGIFLGLNLQACNSGNFFFFKIHGDPGNQLQWIQERLIEAREEGAAVWLASHISPGSIDCFSEWSLRFRSLIDAFQDVVRVHFVGHEHQEFFSIVRDADTHQKAINYILGGGSLTTYQNKNPNVQVIEIHKKSGIVVNSISFSVDLKKTNLIGKPQWKVEYDYLSLYQIQDLRPQNLDKVTQKIKTIPQFFEKYKYASLLQNGWYQDDELTTYCQTNHSVQWEKKDCKGESRFDYSNNFIGATTETLMSPWYSFAQQ